MDVTKKELVNGKESVSAEAKRLFAEIDFGSLKKSEFVRQMLRGLTLDASEVHELVKHLEAVWRGKAAPTMAELTKAHGIAGVSESPKPAGKVEKTFDNMSTYVPKYPATQALKEKMGATTNRRKQ
ncbi:MAG: hypothetical protein U0X91_20880 [Spirosomataceae bacterium]